MWVGGAKVLMSGLDYERIVLAWLATCGRDAQACMDIVFYICTNANSRSEAIW